MAVFGLQQVVISTESKGSVLMKNEATDDGGGGFFVDNPPRLFPTVCHIMLFQAPPTMGRSSPSFSRPPCRLLSSS